MERPAHDDIRCSTGTQCFRCHARGVAVAPSAMPSRFGSNGVPPRTPDNPWERGIKGETRPDGSFAPYLNERLEPIGVKEWGENRHKYETRLAELKGSAPTQE